MKRVRCPFCNSYRTRELPSYSYEHRFLCLDCLSNWNKTEGKTVSEKINNELKRRMLEGDL